MRPALPPADAVARVLLARFRRAVGADPALLRREPWYAREARRVRELARARGVDEGRALDAIAVLSPATDWDALVARFGAFLDGDDRIPAYGRARRQARAILAGTARPTGPKVSRFARNLRGDPSVVTVDRWAARAAGLPESGGAPWYRCLEAAYTLGARAAGLPPSAFQAVVWEGIRSGALTRAGDGVD